MKAERIISIAMLVIALASCIVALGSKKAAEESAETAAAALGDARDAERADRERAEYLSYRLGVDLGMYVNLCQHEDERLAPAAAFAKDSLRIRLAGLKEDLHLGDEVPESLSAGDVERIKMCIYDTYGQPAVDSYALGVDLGLAEGLLLPWRAQGNAESSSPTVPDATFEQVDKLAGLVNKQLRILGFPQTVQLHGKEGASLFRYFDQLDLELIGGWDSQAGRWRRSPQSSSEDDAPHE